MTDLRVIKTKKAILRTLNELLRLKPIAKITVTELAIAAEINKATFYLHYKDIFDVYQHALNQHLAKIANNLPFLDEFSTEPEKFADHLIDISFNRQLFQNDPYLTDANSPYNRSGIEIFSDALADAILATNQLPNTRAVKLRLEYLFSGIGTLIRFREADDSDEVKLILLTGIRSQFRRLPYAN